MQLNLRTLQDAHEHFDLKYEPSQFPPAVDRGGVGEGRRRTEGDAFRVVSPVMLSFNVDRQETGRYRLAGRLTGEIELTCSRCLEPFAMPVATEFDLRYIPRTENTGEGETEVEEDDLSTAFYDNDQIDLGHLIMEQFQLALPMKPLCSEDCKGLCPQCGTNLNTGACDCHQTWQDPRFAALKAMKRTD